MASVLLPNLKDDGLQATFISGRKYMFPDPALAVYVPETAAFREDAIRETASSMDIGIVRSLGVETRKTTGRLLLLEPHANLNTRAFWKSVGLNTKTLARVDAAEISLTENRRQFISALGIRKDFFEVEPIGMSRWGARVFETPLGRIAHLPKDNSVYGEWDIGPSGKRAGEFPHFFLKATNIAELSECAWGVVRNMSGGQPFNQNSFLKLYENVVSEDLRETNGMTVANFHEHVEAHLGREIDRAMREGNNPRNVARTLNARLPNRSARSAENLRFDQFSTPLTVAAAAAQILCATPGERVLEPMVGNGVLASVLAAQGVEITGVEIDPARAERARLALGSGSTIIESSFENFAASSADEKFDIVLMNPPFGTEFKAGNKEDQFGRQIRLARADHHYVFEALKARKEDGRAFLVMAGDYVQEGVLDGSRKHFDTWLRSAYEIAGAAVLDGSLYRKMGTTFPVIMYAIGPQRDVALTDKQAQELAPDIVPVLRTLDELHAWSDLSASNMLSLVRRRDPAFGAGIVIPQADLRVLSSDGSGTSDLTWGNPARPENLIAAFSALSQGQAVELPTGTLVRIHDTQRQGWGLQQRDPSGEVTLEMDDRQGQPGWSRDQALQCGMQVWQAAETMSTQASVAPAIKNPAPEQAVSPDAPGQEGEPEKVARDPAQEADASPAPVRTSRQPAASVRGAAPRRASVGAAPQPQSEPQEEAVSAPPSPAPTPAPPPVAAVSSAVLVPEVASEFIEEDDPFLLPYEPMSNLGEATTRIQRSLSSPIMAALADVRRRYGDVDDMVSTRLGISLTDMEQRFSPEQIDAFALSYSALDRGHGFLNSDSMGVGKGRFLAGHIASALMEDRPVMFFTERPDLFQDILARDLCDVTSLEPSELPEKIRPYIFNSAKESRVLDYDNPNKKGQPAVLFQHSAKDHAAARTDGTLPADCNMVLGTYSQFSHSGGDWKVNAMLQWLENTDHSKPPVLLIDEAHRAAGDESRCGEAMSRVVAAVSALEGSVIYSSATPLKSLKNIKLYTPILPNVGMSTEHLMTLVETSPLAIQEALAYEMARAGTLISREMDQAGVQREFVNLIDLNPEKYAKLRDVMDDMSRFLGELLEQSGEVSSKAETISRILREEEARTFGDRPSQVQVTSASPATRFHTISQYMMFAFSCQFAEELALNSIANGQKPVLVVENVGDSMVEYLLDQHQTDDSENSHEDEDAPAGVDVDGDTRLGRLPNLGDLLVRTADAMLWVTTRNGFGVTGKERMSHLEPWLEDFTERVRDIDFSDLSTSGIDQIRQRLGQYDLSVGELTRRRYEMTPDPEGGYTVSSRAKPRLQETVRAFNNGDLDALVMNRSASSGISMQASPRNGPDLRQRNMIKLQLQADITHERQLDGRIHRTGQVLPGRYTIPMPGFAASDRLAAMYNRKNRSLSSASRASRDNSTNIDNAPDLLNAIGDRVVYNFLSNAPVLAERFGIEVGGEGTHEGMARKFMGRLIILTSDMQTQIMAEVESQFRLYVADLESRGENPLKLSKYEWGASVAEHRVLIAGDPDADQTYRKPLVMNEISFQEEVRPMRWATVLDQVERTRERWSEEDGRFVGLSERFSELEDLRKNGIDFKAGLFDRVLNREASMGSLGLQIVPSDIATSIYAARLEDKKRSGFEKSVIEAADRAFFLAHIIEWLEPGGLIGIDPEVMPMLKDTYFYANWSENHAEDAPVIPVIIRGVRFSEDRPLNFGEWDLDVSIPGSQLSTTLSLAAIYGAQVAATARIAEAMAEDPDFRPDVIEPKTLRSPRRTLALLAAGENEDKAAIIGDLPHVAGELPQERLHDVMSGYFNDAKPGEVTRRRYTLEGNIFAAVSMAVQEKIGEKIIYTAADGEMRHAILLKNDKLAKLTKSIDHALSERTVPAPEDAKALFGLTEATRNIATISQLLQNRDQMQQHLNMMTERHGPNFPNLAGMRSNIVQYSNQIRRTQEQLLPYLADVAFPESNPDPDNAELRAALIRLGSSSAFDTWSKGLIKAVSEASGSAAAIVVGADPFQGVKEDVTSFERTRRKDGDEIRIGDLQIQGRNKVAKNLAFDRQSACVLVTTYRNYVLTHGKGDLPKNSADVNWNVRISPKVSAGVLPGAADSVEALKQVLGHAAQHHKGLTLHGPLRAVFEHAGQIAAEVRKDHALSLSSEKTVTATASTPAMAGM